MSGVDRLARPFYRRDPTEVAPDLLNKLLIAGGRVGRIVEVEAYAGADDPASHAFGGRSGRNASMFGWPGSLYVYFTYGMHWCANAVCDEEGEASAVLFRALAPVAGLDEMWAVRPAARLDRDLCSGPAKLCQALGIAGGHDGADLVTGDHGVLVGDDGTPPPRHPGRSARIGVSAAADRLWRWYVPADPNVSRRAPAAPGPGAERSQP